MSRNIAYALSGLAFVILIGAYFLFQHTSTNDFAGSAATTTLPSLPTSTTTFPAAGTPAGKGSIVVGQAADIKVAFDATNLSVGGYISPITLTLPKGSDGKVLVLLLKDASGKLHDGILLATVVHPTANTYTISGLKLSHVTDAVTGTKTNITAGTYSILAALWDRNPISTAGTYTNFAGNNGIGVQSAPFTIH
jgi:hypothetical protein